MGVAGGTEVGFQLGGRNLAVLGWGRVGETGDAFLFTR